MDATAHVTRIDSSYTNRISIRIFLIVILVVVSEAWDLPSAVDCAIVGGGPAGLSTAIALTKASPASSIAVFERDNFQPKGASISISKAGWISLKELDDRKLNRKWKVKRFRRTRSLVSELKQSSTPVTSVEVKPWTQQKKDENTLK